MNSSIEPGEVLSLEELSPVNDTPYEIEQLPLPPADGGFSLVFGILQEYYSTHDVLKGEKGGLATVGTTSTGILYLISPITFTLLTRYPNLQAYCAPVGLFITVIGSLLSSFADKVWQLIATQGVICAIGNGLIFTPSTLYIDQWFIRRKGLALGLMWAAKSATGVALPFIASTCLDRFGSSTTLKAWTVVTILSTLASLPFMKPRIPVSPSTSIRRIDLSFLRLPTFWTLQAGNVIQGFGYFLPSMYLPSYSTATVGLSATMGTMLVSLFNATSVFGGIALGTLCDRFAITDVLLFSSVGSAVSVFLLWGMSSASNSGPEAPIALLTLFSIFYGFFAGGFSSTWSGAITEIKRNSSPSLDTGLVFGLLAGGRGIGNVISGPLSTALLNQGSVAVHGGTGYATQYGSLIMFTGLTASFGMWAWIWGLSSRVQCLHRQSTHSNYTV
ncbi:MFS monocarboxylate transporter [Penicillium taxi]|uniref:MFS monocarboxylate transporter n=1 Tax=Penicillium taxi TaxID=168475 RepID=UPI002545B5AC|nr:MFS monocarboxylate transporter [Penicillium taxi]KAJ5907634.1 MFS monocarboxylate transporter [Penicillium taxi]